MCHSRSYQSNGEIFANIVVVAQSNVGNSTNIVVAQCLKMDFMNHLKGWIGGYCSSDVVDHFVIIWEIAKGAH